jgi:hypothetical protein
MRPVYVDKLAGEQVDQKLRHFAISNTPPLLFIYLPPTECNQQLATSVSYTVMTEKEGSKRQR